MTLYRHGLPASLPRPQVFHGFHPPVPPRHPNLPAEAQEPVVDLAYLAEDWKAGGGPGARKENQGSAVALGAKVLLGRLCIQLLHINHIPGPSCFLAGRPYTPYTSYGSLLDTHWRRQVLGHVFLACPTRSLGASNQTLTHPPPTPLILPSSIPGARDLQNASTTR